MRQKSEYIIKIVLYFLFSSMTSHADQNDQWASYAYPGGWNGNFRFLKVF